MIQFFRLALLVLIGLHTSHGAVLTDCESLQLKDEIREMMTRFEQGDADAVINKTHPSLFKLMGGKEAFSQTTRTAIDQLLNSDIKFISSDLKNPTQLYSAGAEEVCFVPRTTLMAIQGKKVKTVGFMIAIRPAGGGEWKFLDGSGLRKNPELLKMLLPELDSEVVLPTNTVELLE